MTRFRHQIKQIIYKIFGENFYQKAYVKGKISDIKNNKLDEAELKFVKHFINPNSNVLDIGANYGHYSIEMAKLCPNGIVYAFEPIPFTYKVLEKIIQKFSFKNIKPYNNAVSNANIDLEMVLPKLSFGGPNTGVAYIGENKKEASQKHIVKCLKLDDLIEEKIDFIKIDIEGHEPKAFFGMENLLKKDKPAILIEFSYPCLERANESPLDFSNYIKGELNYQFYQLKNNLLKLVENTPKDGYYFLIPNSKTNDFHTIIKE